MNEKLDDIINDEGQLIFNPYNSINILISENDAQNILIRYGINYPLHNIKLYQRAFVHRSYIKRTYLDGKEIITAACPPNCLPLHSKSNERIEYLGDGVLELVAKFYLYRKFHNETEEFLTKTKIAVVKNKAIGRMAYEMGLHKWLIISNTAEEKNVRNDFDKLGCLFEAFIGAVFLDFSNIHIDDKDGWFQNIFVSGPGFQMAQIFIEAVFEQHVDWDTVISKDDNYKNILQVKIQKEFKVTPRYINLGNPHTPITPDPSVKIERIFNMGVFLCIGYSVNEEVDDSGHDLVDSLRPENAIHISHMNTINKIHQYVQHNGGRLFLFLGSGQHKKKREAEQLACNNALHNILLDDNTTI